MIAKVFVVLRQTWFEISEHSRKVAMVMPRHLRPQHRQHSLTSEKTPLLSDYRFFGHIRSCNYSTMSRTCSTLLCNTPLCSSNQCCSQRPRLRGHLQQNRTHRSSIHIQTNDRRILSAADSVACDTNPIFWRIRVVLHKLVSSNCISLHPIPTVINAQLIELLSNTCASAEPGVCEDKPN